MSEKKQHKDIYYTISKVDRSEIKIKGSRFIASAKSVANKKEAEDFLQDIRSEFYDATHNCFAWRIGAEGLEFRASDDGEPSGSAGKPILFTIKKFNLSDVIVIVTRFYGGTKLGVGGLARAYSESASETLSKCKKKAVHLTSDVEVFCTYEDISPVKRLIDDISVKFEEEYTDSVRFLVSLHRSDIDKFIDQITEFTAGRAGCVKK